MGRPKNSPAAPTFGQPGRGLDPTNFLARVCGRPSAITGYCSGVIFGVAR
jgi:hypothetical protein